MTVKVNEIVIDALEELVVQAEESSVPQAEANAAIRAMNDMLTMWQTKGVDIGYTIVSNMGDTVTVPRGAIMGIKANLAVYLAPKYDVQVSVALVQKAREGWTAIVDLSTSITRSFYPSTLPRGSGNTDPSWTDNTFYPEQESTILTETGGSIALEEDTEGQS